MAYPLDVEHTGLPASSSIEVKTENGRILVHNSIRAILRPDTGSLIMGFVASLQDSVHSVR